MNFMKSMIYILLWEDIVSWRIFSKFDSAISIKCIYIWWWLAKISHPKPLCWYLSISKRLFWNNITTFHKDSILSVINSDENTKMMVYEFFWKLFFFPVKVTSFIFNKNKWYDKDIGVFEQCKDMEDLLEWWFWININKLNFSHIYYWD